MKKILLFLFFMPCLAIWSEVLLYSNNSFYRHPDWIVDKAEVQYFTMGAYEYLFTRAGVAQNRINLAPWWGFQGLTLRKELRPRSLQFQLKLDPKAYLYVTFGDESSGRRGLRLSRDPLKKSAFLEMRSLEEITAERGLDLPLDGSPVLVELIFQAGGSLLRLNGKDLYRDTALPAKGFLSFRGGAKPSAVSDLKVVEESGEELFFSFRNTEGALKIYLLVGIVLVFCGGFFYFLAPQNRLMAYLLFLLVAGVSGASYYLFDFYVWSEVQEAAMTKKIHTRDDKEISFFERHRYQFIAELNSLLGIRPDERNQLLLMGYTPIEMSLTPIFCLREFGDCRVVVGQELVAAALASPKNGPRILFIGASQTAGAGARKMSETFFVRTHEFLQKNFNPKMESLNIAFLGARLAEQIDLYEKNFYKFRPDFVVINFAVNDRARVIRKTLPGLVKRLQADGAKVILVKEAVTAEVRADRRDELTAIEAVGREYGVVVLPSHEFMNAPETTRRGILWWDLVHMTTFGQEIFAGWLGGQLLPLLKAAKR